MKKTIGLLVMAYGTPYTQADIEPYYTHIRGGRKPSKEALDSLTANYNAIGGISPLAKITTSQMEALEQRLNEVQENVTFRATLGLRHITPFIEDGVVTLANSGVDEIISIVLAPHYSTMSIRAYNDRAQKAAEEAGIPYRSVDQWYDVPDFISYWANSVGEQLKLVKDKEKAIVLFSAHSLPEKILKDGDPYAKQLEETAHLIAEAGNIKNYMTAWQSEGNTNDKWLGPDVCDVTEQLYEKGYREFIYAPVGFVADHLEVLFDNDIECKEVCDRLGATYYRAAMPNTHPLFIEAMAKVILQSV